MEERLNNILESLQKVYGEEKITNIKKNYKDLLIDSLNQITTKYPIILEDDFLLMNDVMKMIDFTFNNGITQKPVEERNKTLVNMMDNYIKLTHSEYLEEKDKFQPIKR